MSYFVRTENGKYVIYTTVDAVNGMYGRYATPEEAIEQVVMARKDNINSYMDGLQGYVACIKTEREKIQRAQKALEIYNDSKGTGKDQ